MVQQITLRPAQPEDFAFCQRTYFEPMRATIEELGLDEARHLANFANRWQVEQVRIVMMCGQVIGWLQTASTDATCVGPLRPPRYETTDYTDYMIRYQARTYNVFDDRAKDAAE
jgi:hypothetical protein